MQRTAPMGPGFILAELRKRCKLLGVELPPNGVVIGSLTASSDASLVIERVFACIEAIEVDGPTAFRRDILSELGRSRSTEIQLLDNTARSVTASWLIHYRHFTDSPLECCVSRSAGCVRTSTLVRKPDAALLIGGLLGPPAVIPLLGE